MDLSITSPLHLGTESSPARRMDSRTSTFPDAPFRVLTPSARRVLETPAAKLHAKSRVFWVPRLFQSSFVDRAIGALDDVFTPLVKPAVSPIPPEAITGMRRNYTESLPKTMRNSTVSLNGKVSAARRAARQIGLLDFLLAPAWKTLAETLTGFTLGDSPGLQLILYREGDYVGPHNDHHPEEAHLRKGYIDLQLTLTNRFVEHQSFLYESRGLFNNVVNVAVPSGLSISFLPFWHQVTPLQAKPDSRTLARRWLLLVSWYVKSYG